ncbi:uncharacterized protein LOC129216379 [Uloborus diversus]|uniref:uncharacterized protein LOC129216379 n=1 Tax=Uloborus diversus TaxID=327109 RepID=UPI00240A71DD|nr:uncharacterized protein LOC129216379 [Uloborus diversus]
MASSSGKNSEYCKNYRIRKKKGSNVLESITKKAHIDRIVQDALALENPVPVFTPTSDLSSSFDPCELHEIPHSIIASPAESLPDLCSHLIHSTRESLTECPSPEFKEFPHDSINHDHKSSTDEEPEIFKDYQKRHKIPDLPPNDISACSLQFSSGLMVSEKNRHEPPLIASTPKHPTLPDTHEIKILFKELIKVYETSNQRMKNVEQQLIGIKMEMSELKKICGEGKNEIVQQIQLPNVENLPLDSDPAVMVFNNKLREDKQLQSGYVRFLYSSCAARNISTFMTTCLRKLMTHNVAILYSRLGRKGKKSFMSLTSLYDTIIGAATMKFPSATPEELSEKLGKSLALSGDWDGRRKSKPAENEQEKNHDEESQSILYQERL